MKDLMFDVLVSIELVEWLAKNMHYRANEKYAYALHTLADRCDFGPYEDDLKECYWLGFIGSVPPNEVVVHDAAVSAAKGLGFDVLTNKELLEAVYKAAGDGEKKVEEAKGIERLPGGVHAILDNVSTMLLRAKALCWMSLNSFDGCVPVDKSSKVTPERGLAKYLAVEVV